MGRKARQPGEKAVMIWPSINDPYTYLDDLFAPGDGPRSYSVAIGSYAQGILNMEINGNGHDDQKFSQDKAILFLRTTAAAQQSAEAAFLKAKIKEIQNIGGEIGEQLEQRLNVLTSDPSSFDYIEFINIINEAMSNIKNYKARLKNILSGKQHRDLERNILTSAGTVLKTYSNRRRQFNLSVEELVRMISIRFLQDKAPDFVAQQARARIKGAQHFAAAQILLQKQLAAYINDHRPELLKKQNEFMDEDAFIQLYDNLSKEMDEYFNQETMNRMLSNDQLLDEIVEQFGIEVSASAKVEKTSKKTTTKNQDKNGGYRGKAANEKSQEILKKLELSNKLDPTGAFDKLVSRITLKYNPDRIISFEEELQTMVTQALNGHVHFGQKLNMGTDSISIMIPTIKDDDKSMADNAAKTFSNNLKQTLIQEKAANDPQKTREIYDKELDKLNTSLAKIGQGFIMHETTKLYTSIEGGNAFFKDSPGFGGREMNIMNYLGSIDQFGTEIGIDTNWLRFLILNLPNGALGSGNKTKLEEILAVAAGLIMFDDFSIIAKSSIQDIQFSNITNVHFYKLNGVYVPCSYFLHAVANTFEQIVMYSIDFENAITVKITPTSISYTRPEPWEQPTQPEDWTNIRNAAGDTKIKMYFAAKFLALISNALNAG